MPEVFASYHDLSECDRYLLDNYPLDFCSQLEGSLCLVYLIVDIKVIDWILADEEASVTYG